MATFRRQKINDVLFLMPVRLENEKPSKGKIRMLYCDAAGRVYAQIMNRVVYELAEDSVKRMVHDHKPFATIGLEISPGKFVPTAVEIGSKEVWALEHILEHAVKKGSLPDILKKYLKPIITMGKANREAVISEHKKSRRRVHAEATPRVLDRLPYYPEKDTEAVFRDYLRVLNQYMDTIKSAALSLGNSDGNIKSLDQYQDIVRLGDYLDKLGIAISLTMTDQIRQLEKSGEEYR